jgi:hypothetical protein
MWIIWIIVFLLGYPHASHFNKVRMKFVNYTAHIGQNARVIW